ncbi:hypothetical protein XENOCAPTIV_014387 [Xenoophorus captivus]|uniref:Uncharacterized protein n=1 Tax=Xenoophorus captivus TaxID=1517983 RepID=A0ABV0QSY6_9TELE
MSRFQPGPIDLQSDGDSHIFQLQMSPCSAINNSKPAWEYDVPEIAFRGVEDKKMPEMPNLESFLGNSLQTRYGRSLKVGKDTTINSVVLDEPTQEFSYGTPRIRTNYLEPSTPEMPDLSSVTQDICKVRETKEFTMEDLRRVISVGTMGSVYILCLKELQRLEHVDGVLEAAVYKLITAT